MPVRPNPQPRTSARTTPKITARIGAKTQDQRTLLKNEFPDLKNADLNQPTENVDPETLAQRRLRLAKELISIGKIEPGVRWLKEIVKKYPRTSAAKEAEEILVTKFELTDEDIAAIRKP